MREEFKDIEDKDVKFKDIKIQGQCIKRMAEKGKSVKDKDMYILYEQTVQDKDIQAKILNFLELDMETKTLVKFKH